MCSANRRETMISFNPLWKTLIDRHIKKQELAEMIGVTRKSISMMARNEGISMKLLDRICRELGCSVQDVIEYVPDADAEE